MDCPAVTKLFRRFATHCFCRKPTAWHRGIATTQWRSYTPKTTGDVKRSGQSSWQQRNDQFSQNRVEEFKRYPQVTADGLRKRKERPRRVKMLMRDFIEDSLYNPAYGYFSQHATIFSPGEPFDFNSMAGEPEFLRELGTRYTRFEDELDGKGYDDARQLWHTPTELFGPYYGEAIGRYMAANYKLTLYPYHDLVIYELGAGNGTLMLHILDYLRRMHPEIYERTQYRIIEVSSALATLQAKNLQSTAASRGHARRVTIINQSIFDWHSYVSTPCFFLAMEVFDNFAHDILRYDPFTEEPMQGSVLIDADGEFYEFYTRAIDPVASRFLHVRDAACPDQRFPHPLRSSKLWRSFRHSLPLAPNLTLPEYIPTRLMQFFSILGTKFPAHRLITADFDRLPQAVPGYNAPVVQTRYQRRTVPVTTPMVYQGYFDVLFPTDFAVVEDIYRALTGRLSRVMKHEDFFRRWADVDATQLRSGENAMLSWYQNQSVMVTI